MFFYKIILPIIIVLLVATEGIYSGFKIGGVDLYRLLELAIFSLLLKHFYSDIINNKVLYKVFIFVTILILFLSLKLMVVTFVYNDLEMTIFNDYLRLILMFIFLYLTYYVLKKDFKYLNLLILINLPIMLIAFFQFKMFPFSETLWEFKFNYFNYNSLGFVSVNPDYEISSGFRSRVAGLYANAMPLAYVLCINMIIGVYLYVKTKKSIYILYFMFLGVIAAFTLTRSIVLSFIILLPYVLTKYFLNSKGIKKYFVVVFITIFSFGVGSFYQTTSNSLERLSSTTDESATGRLPLVFTGAYALIMNPLGISKQEYNEVKHEMYQIFDHQNILDFSAHNGLLNIGFTYTTLGLFYFILFIFSIKKIIKPYIPKEMRIFFFVAVLAYLANTMFHNDFILLKDFYGLIFLAIVINEYQINSKGHVY